jgi:hypothetical protein
MPRCPNCNRETMRTEDWACQWCGYPLPSGAYKKVAKTYKQLREERLQKPEPTIEPEAGAVLESQKEPIPEAEPIPEEIPILLPKQETIKEPEMESKVETAAELEEEAETAQEGETELEVELETRAETAEEPEAKTEPEEEIEQIQEPEPEAEPPAMELTVEELLAAYEADEAAADEKFVNKVLRLTGVVSMIDIKDKLETHYIRLTGAEGDLLQSVQCVFNKKHKAALEELEKGQTIAVQGTYNGSMIAIRMVNCVLVP